MAWHLTAHGEFSRTISRILRAGPSLYQFRSAFGYLCRYTREITDALVSDRRRRRLFPDHSVDRPGAGSRLEGANPAAEQCVQLEADLFTQFTDSLAYMVLCLSVWGAGEGIGALLDHQNAGQRLRCWIRSFRALAVASESEAVAMASRVAPERSPARAE